MPKIQIILLFSFIDVNNIQQIINFSTKIIYTYYVTFMHYRYTVSQSFDTKLDGLLLVYEYI